jgi:hypothetical protein
MVGFGEAEGITWEGDNVGIWMAGEFEVEGFGVGPDPWGGWWSSTWGEDG